MLVAGKNNPRRGDAAYVRGVLLTLGISVMWSTSPLFYRAIGDTPVMEIVFYRSLFLTIGVAFFVGLKYRSSALLQIRAIGASGLVAAFTLVASSMFYVAAIDRTTIAVVAFTYGATPFFAAALGLLILHEPVGKGTWIAMGLAASGITLMVVESFKLGSAAGTALALGSTVAAAAFAISLRYGRNVDQVPAILVSGLLGLTVTAPFVSDFAIPLRDLTLCAVQGLCISAFCNSMFTVCARVVPAAELTLLSLLEIVLSPIGAWLIFAEVPTTWIMIGGALLLASIFGQAIGSIMTGRSRR